ncbi:tryptophan hydroxylase [Janthinobacterium sp. B9-8]|uniref:tryptophan hydroxylase n=1 Tax=Janthinobacterium sp. B9-8 TaxID=1236179 RepID=UPI00061CE94B|nr:tryptophan hydroxylase [Janthinobacterium sp. B9-8]AMC36545.1 tryptophan hydroxylase [Janthinobacterium sp. B9-8]
MKILVVGAGPAGLMFASQLKKLKQDWDIAIVEKNTVDEIVGWGVVLPGKAPHHPANPLSYLPDYEEIDAQYIDEFCLVNQDDRATASTGITLCGAERKSLVGALRKLCTNLLIPITYSSPVFDEDGLDTTAYDLVVIANGINNISNYFKDALAPEVEFGKNRYMWYGTSKIFDAMNLIFKPTTSGVFIAHAYKYSSTMSTFVVECSEETYHRSGIESLSETDAKAFIADVFSVELDGLPVEVQPGLQWRNFVTLSHTKAYEDNLVLLGDALQTGHFSIGHGTTMAVVAAQMLVKALYEHAEVNHALEDFNQKVMPLMQLFSGHAGISRTWFETADERMDLTAAELAKSFSERREQLPPLPAALGQALGMALTRKES